MEWPRSNALLDGALLLVEVALNGVAFLAEARFAGARLAVVFLAGGRFAVAFVDLALDRRCCVPCVAATPTSCVYGKLPFAQ